MKAVRVLVAAAAVGTLVGAAGGLSALAGAGIVGKSPQQAAGLVTRLREADRNQLRQRLAHVDRQNLIDRIRRHRE